MASHAEAARDATWKQKQTANEVNAEPEPQVGRGQGWPSIGEEFRRLNDKMDNLKLTM